MLKFLLLISLLLVTLSPALTGCGVKKGAVEQSLKDLTKIRAKQEELEQKPKKQPRRIPRKEDLKQQAQFNTTNRMSFYSGNATWYFTKATKISEIFVVFDVSDDDNQIFNFVDSTISVLSEQGYNNLLAIEKTDVCPAPFLNSAVSHQSFFAKNPEVIKTLNNSKRGERLRIEGFTLTLKGYVGQHPIDLTLPPNSPFIFVESVKKG